MPLTVTRAGRYRATPYTWTLEESSKSDSKGLRVGYVCTEFLDEADDKFVKLDIPYPIAEGTIWFIGKDGCPRENAVKTMGRALKWSGNPDDFLKGSAWKPPPVDIDVEAEEYNGQLRYKVQWVHEPGSKGNGVAIVKGIKSTFGDTFKNIIAASGGGPQKSDAPADETAGMSPNTRAELKAMVDASLPDADVVPNRDETVLSGDDIPF